MRGGGTGEGEGMRGREYRLRGGNEGEGKGGRGSLGGGDASDSQDLIWVLF